MSIIVVIETYYAGQLKLVFEQDRPEIYISVWEAGSTLSSSDLGCS